MSARLISFLRDAEWLDARRAQAYALILLCVTAIGFAIGIVLSKGLIDPTGKPLGTDFMSFYAAGKLVLEGHPADPWTPAAHQAAEDAIFGKPLGYWAFFYPPPYLLICIPLALLPYGAALIVWSASTATAFVTLARRWVAQIDAKTLIPVLAFPALWVNLGNGQNAALTTAIWLGGALLLDRRPFIAGLILGCLAIKPQLAIAIPFVLAAGNRWKSFAGAVVSALGLCALAWLVVGTDGYMAFLNNGALARSTLEGLVDPAKMQSLFAALTLWRAPSGIAYTIHIILALAVLVAVILIMRKHRPDGAATGALMAATSLGLTPFLLDYDLLVLALPLGWLAVQGIRRGFLPWEKIILLAAYVSPLVTRPLAQNLHLPLGPVVLLLVFWAVVRRIGKAPIA